MNAIAQRTEEWRSQRAGRITASGFADAIAMNIPEAGAVYKSGPKKGKPKLPHSTSARDTYMRTIVAEILSGRPKHEISSKSLSWGTEAEEYARQAYELETGLLVVQSEFLTHPEYDFIGASPDGLVGADGGLEMKSPHDEQVHIGTWLNGMPDDHLPQVQGNIMVTGRKWWDFVSYDPRQAEPYRIYIQRIARDDKYIDETLLPGLLKFWEEVHQMLRRIKERAA